jgi:hypothetical protein
MPFIFAGFFWIWYYSTTYYPTENFEKEKWVKTVDKRYRMGENIVNSKMLIGKDSHAVKGILGNPDWRREPSKLWQYQMGFSDGFFFPVVLICRYIFQIIKLIPLNTHNILINLERNIYGKRMLLLTSFFTQFIQLQSKALPRHL